MRDSSLLKWVAIGVAAVVVIVFIVSQGSPSIPTSTPLPISPQSGERTGRGVSPSIPTSTPLPILNVTVRAVSPRRENDFQALLLYDSSRLRPSDINFRKLAEYYGVRLRQIDLSQSPLSDTLLKNQKGQYYLAIAINANTLERRSPRLLGPEQIALLRKAVESGANLLVSELTNSPSQYDHGALRQLTGLNVTVGRPQDSHRDWMVSHEAPETTREFTGELISVPDQPQNDFSLALEGSSSSIISLVTSLDDVGQSYTITAKLQFGSGSMYLDAGSQVHNLEQTPMEVLYSPKYFSDLISTMFFLRSSLGNRVWHNDHRYANLTIDDPALVEPYRGLSYVGLLREMQSHNFHTTIAFIPKNAMTYQESVIEIFRRYPQYYSLVVHGNNHDGYEFYKYCPAANDPFPARPLSAQEADIREALERMEAFAQTTGISFGRIMIFPYGIAPEATLALLKKYNFNITVNGKDVPLDATRSGRYSFNMYPANMDYANFASVVRRLYFEPPPSSSPAFKSHIFDFFVGRPVLAYTHENYFRGNIGAFNPVADVINRVGRVEWQSLDYIAKHLYLQKANDDGSNDVQMYGNHIIISNDTDDVQTYHFVKEELLNVPIAKLTVNGQKWNYDVRDGKLLFDLELSARSSAEVIITYDATTTITSMPCPTAVAP